MEAFPLAAQVTKRGKDLSSVQLKARHEFFPNLTTSCCVFQVRYKLHQRNVSDGIVHCANSKKYLAATMVKERESAAFALMTLYYANWPTSKNRHPWTEASMMSPSC